MAITGAYPPNPQYPDVGEQKTFCEKRGVWIRKLDCAIAERFLGFQWMACTPKQDFCGNTFSAILTCPPLDGQYILEPDTRVPNFSTNLSEAAKLVKSSTQLPGGKPRDIAEWICRNVLD